jgi:hypothetical protein
LSKPILVIRWIYSMSEPDEIKDMEAYLGGHIENIQFVRARSKSDLCAAIVPWLESPDARLIYIGAHGNKRGLTDRRKGGQLLSWEELGRCFASVPQAFDRHIEAIFGACNASLAPAQWAKHKLKIPLSRLLCTADEPLASDVCDLIVEILRRDEIQERDFLQKGDLQEFSEHLDQLLGNQPSRLRLRFFLRGSNKRRYDFDEIALPDLSAVEDMLARRNNKRLADCFERAVRQGAHLPVPTTAELEQTREDASRLNREILDAPEGLFPARSLPGKDVRNAQRKGPKRSHALAKANRLREKRAKPTDKGEVTE